MIQSVNVVHKMSYLHKFCGVVALLLTLSFSGSVVLGQDAAAPAGGGDAEKGKALFVNNCAQCHATSGEKIVGPGLKGIKDRAPGGDWLHKWIKNSSALIATGDAYANQVFNANGKIQMSSFPGLSDADIDGILAYVDQANAPQRRLQPYPVLLMFPVLLPLHKLLVLRSCLRLSWSVC